MAEQPGDERHRARVGLPLGPAPEVRGRDGREEARRGRENAGHHGAVEEARTRIAGGPAHEAALARLGHERGRGRQVHEQLHHDDLHRSEGHAQAEQHGEQHDRGERRLARQVVAHRLAEVREEHPPLGHRPHDGREVVVGEDDVGRLAGHVRPAPAHGDADVRGREGGGVVDAVSRHRDALARGLPGGDDAQLVLGRGPRHDGSAAEGRAQLLVGQAVQLHPGEDP